MAATPPATALVGVEPLTSTVTGDSVAVAFTVEPDATLIPVSFPLLSRLAPEPCARILKRYGPPAIVPISITVDAVPVLMFMAKGAGETMPPPSSRPTNRVAVEGIPPMVARIL